MRARRASPFRLALLVLVPCVLLIGGLLGKFFLVRRNQGVPMIDGLRTESPYAFTKIIVRPGISDGRVDPESLAPAPVEITDPDAIHEVMNAVDHSERGDSPSSDDSIHWKCSLLFVARGHTWQCQATSTDRGVLLDFWSNGLSGWALGTLHSDALTDVLPRVTKLAPPAP